MSALEYEADDPPYVEKSAAHRWLSRHYEMWKLTWLCQLVWLTIYMVITIIGWTIVGSTLARADEPLELQGAFCTTQAHMERLIAVSEHASNGHQAIEMLNKEVRETACRIMVVMATKGAPLANLNTHIGYVDVIPLRVTHILIPFMGFVELETPTTVIAIFASTARGA